MPQVTLLRELRPRPQLERMEISSVDGFQGVCTIASGHPAWSASHVKYRSRAGAWRCGPFITCK